MAVTKNDVTGDKIKSKGNSQAYKSGWDAIWGNKEAMKKMDDVLKGKDVEVEPMLREIKDEDE